jgi:hypothetical protein
MCDAKQTSSVRRPSPPVVIRYDALEKWMADATKAIANEVQKQMASDGERVDPLFALIAQMAVEEPQLDFKDHIRGPAIMSCRYASMGWSATNGILFIGSPLSPVETRASEDDILDERPYDRSLNGAPINVPFLNAVYIDLLHKKTLSLWMDKHPLKRVHQKAFQLMFRDTGNFAQASAAAALAVQEHVENMNKINARK